MPGIFEQLMKGFGSINSRQVKKCESVKKIPYKKLKVESTRIFEESDFDELDDQFAVDPEESEEDEVVLVIDPEIKDGDEVPEDAAEQMVGDLVYKCPVCGGNYICSCDSEKNEALELDDEGTPIECPICGDDSEQILVGEIAPVEGAGEETEMEPLDIDDGEEEVEEEEEVKEESLTELFGKGSNKKAAAVLFKNVPGNPGWDPDSYVMSNSNMGKFKDRKDKLSKAHKGKINFKVMSHDAASKLEKNYMKYADCLDESLTELFGKKNKKKPVQHDPEDFEESCIDCENSPMEPMVEVEDKEEDKPEVKVSAEVVNINFDEKKFESLINRVIKENYKNNGSCKVTKISSSGTSLKVEYVIRSKGGKTRKGTMVGEGYNLKNRKMTINFKDKGAFTESYSKTPAFVVEFVKVRNCLVPTKMNYDYKVKVNESVYRVHGSV